MLKDSCNVHALLLDYCIGQSVKEDFQCPGASGAIIIQPSGSLSGSVLIFNKQADISLSAKDLQRLLFDFAN